jgi:hypothetical protein
MAVHHLKAAEPEAWDDPAQFGAPQGGPDAAYFGLTWHHPRVRASLFYTSPSGFWQDGGT